MKSDLAKIHHARSAKEYPEIDLEDNEWVVLHIIRSKIGLLLIWAGEFAGAGLLTIALIMLLAGGPNPLGLNSSAVGYLYIIIFALYALLIISGIIGTIVYKSNHLYITNRRTIQKSRPSLFVNSTNIIDLQSIEDVSFRQAGLLDYIFKLGTIRMSTVGDETTYTFTMVDTPRDEIKTISSLVYKTKTNDPKNTPS
ncbi:MAG: PH domain-containing protein [Candidatus Nomurabacteria bacterium]|jgi:hypothetical protein|nr:PH domain-containing protein [Candidatus Nomurabacteria bacterium]